MAVTLKSDLSFSLTAGGDGTYRSRDPNGNSGVLSPDYPATAYITAKFDLTIVSPAAGLTGVTIYTDASTDDPFEVPICVRGGAYPFTYALGSAPSGMTINSSTGWVSWTPPSDDTYWWTAYVTDQDGTVASVNVKTVVSSDNVVYVATTGNDSNAGTKAAPFLTVDGFYESVLTDTTHAGKRVVFRAGTYTLTSIDPLYGSLQLNENKPLIWQGYVGETVEFDASSEGRIIVTGSSSDVAFYNLKFSDVDETTGTYPNRHNIWVTSNAGSTRYLFAKCTFENTQPGTAGSDNPSCIFFSNAARTNMSFKGNTYDTLGGSSNGVNGITVFSISGFSIEDEIFKNISGGLAGVMLKTKADNGSVTNCTAIEGMEPTLGPITFLNNVSSENVEIRYNGLKSDDWAASQNYDISPHNDYYWYRNTFDGIVNVRRDAGSSVLFENNVFINTNSAVNGITGTGTTADQTNTLPLFSTTASGIIDSNLLLDSSQQDTYLGNTGWELSTNG